MASFEEGAEGSGLEKSKASGEAYPFAYGMIDFESPVDVLYHPKAGIPAEFCEFSASFEKDVPWIMQHCQEALSPDALARAMEMMNVGDDESVSG